MARSPTAKRKRMRRRRRRRAAGTSAAADETDYLSNLPDDVLVTIASHFPTRLAVSFSLLARRFRHLTTQYRHLDSVTLSQPDFVDPLPEDSPLLLRRLVLTPARGVAPIRFRRVLDIAAEHGVSELAIRVRRRSCLPKNVFSIRSLEMLSLNTCAVPRYSTIACGRLRTLKLHRVAIHQDIITLVLASAAVLETLEIVYCTGFVAGGCTVESSTVRSILFKPTLDPQEATLRVRGLRTVTLYTRPKTLRVELAPAPDVRKAYLHVSKARQKLEFKIRPFLDAGTRLTNLTLRGVATRLLSDEYKDIPKLPITFEDLRILSVSLNFFRGSEVVFLMKLLESCPSLRQLTISASVSGQESALLCFANDKERLANVTESLVEFYFLGFKSQEYEKQLVTFLLTQTKKLKKIGVQFHENEERAVREIFSKKRAPIERKSNMFNDRYLELEYS